MSVNNKKELIKTVLRFRMFELRSFFLLVGQNPNGRKTELQGRALELLTEPSDFVVSAIKKVSNKTSIGSKIRKRFMCARTENCSLNAIPKSYSAKSTPEIPNSSKTVNSGMNFQNVEPVLQNFQHRPVEFIFQFRELPIYEKLSVLQNPMLISKVQAVRLVFYVGSKEFDEINRDNQVQVLLRFGYVETDPQEKDENLVSLTMKVNSMVISAYDSNNEVKTLKSPQIITHLLIKCSNVPQIISLSWSCILSKQFLIGVFLVRKRSIISLIQNLSVQSVQDPNYTYTMIEKTYFRDSEITLLDPSTSLLCPLTKTKIVMPCRSRTCNHIQCFDAASYIVMNETKSRWICPICRKSAEYDDLIVDGLILDILQKAPPDCTKISFLKDRTWIPVDSEKQTDEVQCLSKQDKCQKLKKCTEVVTVDSDSEEENTVSVQFNRKDPCNHLVLSKNFMVNDINSHGFVLKQISQPCSSSLSQPTSIVQDKTGNQCKTIIPLSTILSTQPSDNLQNAVKFSSTYGYNYSDFKL